MFQSIVVRRFIRRPLYQCRALSTLPFDTLKFVRTLESKGFTGAQAEAISDALRDALSSSFHSQVSQSELAIVAKDLDAMRTKFTADLNAHEKAVKEEVEKYRANVRLDWSLEKQRLREESALHDAKIHETRRTLETEISHIRVNSETIKLDIIKLGAGTVVSALGLILAYLRFVH